MSDNRENMNTVDDGFSDFMVWVDEAREEYERIQQQYHVVRFGWLVLMCTAVALVWASFVFDSAFIWVGIVAQWVGVGVWWFVSHRVNRRARAVSKEYLEELLEYTKSHQKVRDVLC